MCVCLVCLGCVFFVVCVYLYDVCVCMFDLCVFWVCFADMSLVVCVLLCVCDVCV